MNTSASLATGEQCLQGAHPVALTIENRDESAGRGGTTTLLALALGSFVIGTSEFASMGIIQLFARDLGLSTPLATSAITAYAFGVVIGAPLVTLAAARLNRRKLLLWLMALFLVGNLASAVADSFGSLIAARFISGLPQGRAVRAALSPL